MTNALAVGVAAAVLALAPLSAAAQPARVITVDMSSIAGRAPAELFVDGNRRVVVHVVKSTFQACTVDSKVEALPPPPNPIAQILAILNPLVGGSAPSPAASNPAGRPSGGEGLARQLERLKADAAALIGDLDGQLAEVRQAAASLPARVACRNTAAENPCTDPAVARARLATLA